MPLHVRVVAVNEFVFLYKTDHKMNVEVLTNCFYIGSDEVFATQKQLSHSAIKGYLVDATVSVEIVCHELFLVVVVAVVAFGLCAYSVECK